MYRAAVINPMAAQLAPVETSLVLFVPPGAPHSRVGICPGDLPF